MKKFSELRKHVDPQQKRARRVKTYEPSLLAGLFLAEVRRARQLTQEDLAATLETTQSAVSRLEHQTDLYVSTLKKYVEALGGRLQVFAEFPDMRIPIDAFPTGDLVRYANNGPLPTWEHLAQLARLGPLEQRRRAVAAYRASLMELVQAHPPTSTRRLLLEHDLTLLDAELGWLDRTLASLSEQASAS